MVYRDYVFDDYGADTGNNSAQTTGGLSRPAGDVRYARDVNSADLVDLSLAVEGDRLHVTAELNALYTADSTVLALAIDTDDDASTGGGTWEGLGVTSTGWDVLHTFDQGDPDTNLIEGSVPLPPGDRWRVQALTAVNGGPVMNVAFRGVDERAGAHIETMNAGSQGVWFDDLQAAALKAGDISAFGHVVDVAELRGGVTRAPVVGPGLRERVYVSDYTLPPGEGMSYTAIEGRGTGGNVPAFDQKFNYFGKYQPYGIYIPDQTGPHGMQMVFHGSNANHASLINQTGMQQDIGEARNRLLVVPLARGPHGYGSDISERDLLDVMADVQANYDIEPERVFAGGYSQGGYISYRMASLYPDRFAGLISWVGFTGDDANGTPAQGEDVVTAGAVGNMIDFVGNLRHVPAALVYAGGDELVQASSAEAMANEFRERDNPYSFYLHPTAEHLTFAILDDWRKESEYTADLTRVDSPARVTYRTAEFLGSPDYAIRHDQAYWVSGIRGREDGYIDVDALSAGCGGPVPVSETGRDQGPEPVPWSSDFRVIVGSEPLARADRVEATLRNVSTLTVDVTEACLGANAVSYKVTTDGPADFLLSDGRQVSFDAAGTFEGVFPDRPPVDIARLAGPERIATAVAASRAAFQDGGAPAVVLARADLYPDALAGTPLAADRGAALLLTGPEALDLATEAELQRVLADGGRVFLLGGEAALSGAVARRVAALGYDAVRYGGENRYATAVVIADEGLADPDTLLLATGRNFGDALTAGAAAGSVGGAVLLTDGSNMAPETRSYLDTQPQAQRYAIGGPAAAADPSAAPVAGDDRFTTAVAVAEEFYAEPAFVGIASGEAFPDALVGGAYASRLGGPVLLSGRHGLPEPADTYLRGNAASIRTVRLFGGSNALSPGVKGDVHQALDVPESITGRLQGDARLEGGCAWISTPEETLDVEYPEGYSLTLEPLQLRDPDGRIVAERGDTLTVEGSRVDIDTTCQVGQVFSATTVRSG